MDSLDSMWTGGGLEVDSLDSMWTGGGLEVDFMDYIETGGGLQEDPWGSVRYRHFDSIEVGLGGQQMYTNSF